MRTHRGCGGSIIYYYSFQRSMAFSIERTIIITTLFFIGFTQAASPRISGKSAVNDYSAVDEDYTGQLFKIHVQDDDTSDHLNVTGTDSFTRQYFDITSYPINRRNNDIWVNVSIRQELDREILGDSVKVQLLIRDDQDNRIGYQFTIYIQDLNDNAPVFEDQPYSLEILELPCNTTTVYTRIHAADADKHAYGRVSYSMQAKTRYNDTKQLYERTFSIDNKTGAITLNKCLDYENINYYQFTVTAKDAGPNGGLTATANFIVHVKDVQEKTPFFTGIPNSLTTLSKGLAQAHPPYLTNHTKGDFSYVPENFTGTVFQIHVRDDDIGDTIMADAADDLTRTYFDIILAPNTPNDVWISVMVKKDLDRETLGNVLRVHLRITDSQQNELSYKFTLNIYDINDNEPVFKNSPYILEIPEAPCNINSTIFTQILALDKDSGDNGKVTYSMEPKQRTIHSRDLFSIDSITGHISLNTCLDYEKGCYHQFIVTAKDSGPNCRRTATAELVVLVKDVPE